MENMPTRVYFDEKKKNCNNERIILGILLQRCLYIFMTSVKR